MAVARNSGRAKRPRAPAKKQAVVAVTPAQRYHLIEDLARLAAPPIPEVPAAWVHAELEIDAVLRRRRRAK